MKKRTWMICVCMEAVLMFTVHAFGMPVTESASAASKTEDSRVLIAYFGRYGNTNFSKYVDATTSASIGSHWQ